MFFCIPIQLARTPLTHVFCLSSPRTEPVPIKLPQPSHSLVQARLCCNFTRSFSGNVSCAVCCATSPPAHMSCSRSRSLSLSLPFSLSGVLSLSLALSPSPPPIFCANSPCNCSARLYCPFSLCNFSCTISPPTYVTHLFALFTLNGLLLVLSLRHSSCANKIETPKITNWRRTQQ